MRNLLGTVLVVGILVGSTAESEAQFSLSIGNPYLNQRLSPTGYASNSFYTSGYVAGPGAISYSSGYRGYAPPVGSYYYARPSNPYGYQNRPYYGAYGYGNDSNGSTDGFRPFRGRYRGYR